MPYPDKINALVDIAGTSTLAAAGHAARHNDVNDALDELKVVLTVPAANTLALAPGGTERLRITSAGNVGIGTDSPASRVNINTATQTSLADGTINSDADGTLLIHLRSGGTQGEGQLGPSIAFGRINSARRGALIGSVQTSSDADQTGLLFAVRSGATTSNDVLVEAMRITSAGNVGIGTSNPNTALHIEASSPIIRLRDTDAASTIFSQVSGSGANGSLTLSADTGDATANSAISMQVDGTERMRIDNAGLITGSGTSLGAWTAYTPTLTASTTNPTLGTGGSVVGYYCQIGKIVFGAVLIQFGTSGTAAGSGTYAIALPVTAKRLGYSIGSGVIQDTSAGARTTVSLYAPNTSTVNLLYTGASGFPQANEAAPWAWAASDAIYASFTYEAA